MSLEKIDSPISILNAITEIQAEFIEKDRRRTAFDTVLEYLLNMTKSEYGFIGQIVNIDGNRAIRTCAVTDISWSDETKKLYDSSNEVGMVFTNLQSLFGAVITSEGVVICNDPSTDPRSGGLPPGHPPMHNFLGVPLYYHSEFIGVAGVSNKPGGYDKSLMEMLNPFFVVCGNLVGSYIRSQQKNKLEQTLKENEEKLSLALSASNVGMWCLYLYDDGSNRLVVDQKTSLLHGVANEKLFPTTKQDFLTFIDETDRVSMSTALENAQSDGKEFSVEYAVSSSAAEIILAGRGQFIPARNGSPDRMLGLCWDITDTKRLERKLTYLANNDPLTKLPNRNAFDKALLDRIRYAKTNHKSIALLYIDVDRFKYVNDNFGRVAGDTLLLKLASRLKSLLKTSDSLYALGSDEFVLLVESCSSEVVTANFARKILSAMEQAFLINGHEYFCAVSVGITFINDSEIDADGILKRADMAMMKAKSNGGNNFIFFCDELQKSAKEMLDLDAKLHRALENNEFSLAYQPQVCMKTKKLVGCEVLLRWHNQDLGMIPPNKFIPIMEENRLILDVGKWLFETSMNQLHRWLDERRVIPDFCMSVNLSPIQIMDDALLKDIQDAVHKTGISYNNLCFEITETVIMHDKQKSQTILSNLREQGASISMDDFGTGFSSLAYLQHFPIDELKLDRAFIANIDTDTTVKAIVDSVIRLCIDLNISVVAEGIENIEQANYLQEHQCDVAQGFYYSKPLSAEDFETFIKGTPKNAS
jgi:diguanylate cyclase (GGDEF)-like protein